MQVDLAGHRLLRDGHELPLKPKAFELLAFLLRHPGQAFTRDQLLEQVWGYDYAGETRTVDVHMHWLRAQVEADPSRRASCTPCAAWATSSVAPATDERVDGPLTRPITRRADDVDRWATQHDSTVHAALVERIIADADGRIVAGWQRPAFGRSVDTVRGQLAPIRARASLLRELRARSGPTAGFARRPVDR